MPLSWNEIRDRSVAFSREWANESSEDAEAKSFWDAFFYVFGIPRRRVASFETPVKKGDGSGGFIDLLWKGTLLVEHKSRGKNLDRAFKQAMDYFPGLKDRDLPKYVLVSDFAHFRLYNLETNKTSEFPLKDLYKHVRLFGFVAGYETHSFGKEDPVNIKAAEHLGKFHDLLKAAGYEGHELELFLVRLLFCLFAEDTSIFEKGSFSEYIEQRTAEDGSDLGMHLAQLFQILNTPHDKRSKVLDEQSAAFQYVNGKLFAELLPLASFNKTMRETLLDCCALDWSRISPAIFGSLFQSIMDADARRELGAHYTTETNILKALRPLFLNDLQAEFEKVKRDRKRLTEFHTKLATIRILDPACGCGNFLVIAYRELRLLEIEVLRELHKSKESGFLDVGDIVWVDVDQFYGIEIEEFPAQIAQVALWLTDHQMNMRVSEEFGQYFVRLPLKKAPNIVHGNALRLDWKEIVKPEELSYIVGNPPFVGKKEQNKDQKVDLAQIFHGVKGCGLLDYVSCWYRKAADYAKGNQAISCAFVSTNSITQGEQVGILWPGLFRAGIKLHFAHRTFQWSSEARGKAAVHCVIIGFGYSEATDMWLYEYETQKSEPTARQVNKINAYLTDGPSVVLERRTRPISPVLEINKGSEATDFGFLIMSTEEKADLLSTEPAIEPWVKLLVGGEELLNSTVRWCLWLTDISPSLLKTLPKVMERVAKVKAKRLESGKERTREWADFPTLFSENRQPTSDYLAIPKVSSERRYYLPMSFLPQDNIASGSLLVIPGAGFYHFGILTSVMHNAWMRSVCGRMKSDYQYSAGIVYNNFPWPDRITEKQQSDVEVAALGVLDARKRFPESTLADLYDPTAMPPDLVKAHHALDRAVEAAYGVKGFDSEAKRVAYLFEQYQKLVSPLESLSTRKSGRRK
jgi:hypothetical protein